MSKLHEFSLKLRYEGGDADQNHLELYDGATSFHGFAQALQIALHAYINKEVASRATALKGATLYLRAPRQGSVLFDIISVIEKYPATTAVSATIFYDFVKYAFSKAVGFIDVQPETPYVSKLSTSDEPFFDDLAVIMEGSLQRAHRAIDEGCVEQVTLERPRSELIRFDKKTSDWVNTRDENPKEEDLVGYVTRYNSITGNGRAYIQSLHRIVPFRPAQEFAEIKRGYLTWSLHGSTTSRAKLLDFSARKIESARGEAKRLVLVDCNQSKITP